MALAATNYQDDELFNMFCDDQRNNDGFPPLDTCWPLSPESTEFSMDPSQPSSQAFDPIRKAIDPPQGTVNKSTSANHVITHGLMTPPRTNDDVMFDNVRIEAEQLESGASIAAPGETAESVERRSPKSKLRSRRLNQAQTRSSNSTAARGITKAKQSRPAMTRKARNGYKATNKEEERDTDGEEKRERFLERNRIAANVCRQKKKVWAKELEEKFRESQTRHRQLMAAVADLQSELLQLKEEAVKHFDCDPNIRRWLTSRVGASQFNMGSSVPMEAPATAQGDHTRQQSFSSTYSMDSQPADVEFETFFEESLKDA